jgi:glycosyltransferase involved in cell wall biosynthesis
MTRQITPFKDLSAIWQLYKLFKKEKPDIVHSHTPKAGLLAMVAARLSGVPIRIHTVAGLRFTTTTGLFRWILVEMEKFTYRFSNHVWPNSNSIMDFLKEKKLARPAKLGMIGKGSSNGIDLTRFSTSALKKERIEETKRLINYDPNLIYILAVGRIVKDKGTSELLEAFTRSFEEDARLRLVMVGTLEDDLDPISEESRKILKTHQGIINAGWHDEVEYFMATCDFFIHASYREGFPNVLLQAGAMGCPIICSRIEGNVDIVEDNVSGLIFTVRDSDDLYQKLKFAIANRDRMRAMATKLRGIIEEHFDQRNVMNGLKTRYMELLSQRNSNKH